MLIYVLASLAFSGFLTHVARRYRFITRDAVPVAFVIGFLVTLSGLQVLVPFLVFLASSGLVTRLGRARKEELGVAGDLMGRNWRQVLAVGAVPALAGSLSLVALLLRDPWGSSVLTTTAVATIAYSNADTWASEVGVLHRGRPRLILKPWIKVDPGVSGGVTWVGELSSLAGSSIVALSYLATGLPGGSVTPVGAFTVMLCGYLGEVIDSTMGSLLQVKYLCTNCGALSDHEVHSCGSRGVKASGLGFISNEVINLLSSATLFLVVLLLATTAPWALYHP